MECGRPQRACEHSQYTGHRPLWMSLHRHRNSRHISLSELILCWLCHFTCCSCRRDLSVNWLTGLMWSSESLLSLYSWKTRVVSCGTLSWLQYVYLVSWGFIFTLHFTLGISPMGNPPSLRLSAGGEGYCWNRTLNLQPLDAEVQCLT